MTMIEGISRSDRHLRKSLVSVISVWLGDDWIVERVLDSICIRIVKDDELVDLSIKRGRRCFSKPELKGLDSGEL